MPPSPLSNLMGVMVCVTMPVIMHVKKLLIRQTFQLSNRNPVHMMVLPFTFYQILKFKN